MIYNLSNYSTNSTQNRSAQPECFKHFSSVPPIKSGAKNTFYTTKTEEETKAIGKRIVKVAILTTLCVFIAIKGSPKKLRSKLDQANKNFIDKNNLGEGAKKGPMFKVREGLRRLAETSKAIFNLAPLKDVLLAKTMQKSKFTNNLAKSITNLFERISFRTLRGAYRHTNEKLEIFFADCAELNSKMPQDKIELVNSKIAKIRQVFAEGFGETARRKRLAEIKNEFDGFDPTGKHKLGDSLMDKVWNETYHDSKNFRDKKIYTKFISEELVAQTKLRNAGEVHKFKYQISNSLKTLCNDCYKLLIHIDTFIEPTDDVARNSIKPIANRLKEYKKELETTTGDGRELLLGGDNLISTNLVKLDNDFKKSNRYKTDIVEEVSTSIKALTDRLEHHERGGVNEILNIYKEHLSEKEFLKLLDVGYDATNSLEKSYDMETDKMFDKVRDLKIGSAPKDTLLLLVPLGGVGYGISKTKTTDERVSVGIKYGVPIIGAIGITMYCTVGLISAGPSLLIGLLSGLALNQMGTGLDNVIKRYKAKHSDITKQQ